MKKILIASLITSSIFFLLPYELYSEEQITWYDYNRGIALAKKSKKHVIIDFYADWCGWCKVMDKETFGDPAVSKIMKKHYINIRINTMEQVKNIRFKKYNLTAQEFASLMGANSLPTVVFMDHNENPIIRIPGFMNKDVFLPLLKYINDKCYLKNINLDDYIKGKSKCGK